jgi:mRNA interferase MazF
VVISSDSVLRGESHELVVIVPLSKSRPPSEVRPHLGPETGIDHSSAAICRAVRGVSRTRLLRRLGNVSPEKMAEIEQVVELVLSLDDRT